MGSESEHSSAEAKAFILMLLSGPSQHSYKYSLFNSLMLYLSAIRASPRHEVSGGIIIMSSSFSTPKINYSLYNRGFWFVSSSVMYMVVQAGLVRDFCSFRGCTKPQTKNTTISKIPAKRSPPVSSSCLCSQLPDNDATRLF